MPAQGQKSWDWTNPWFAADLERVTMPAQRQKSWDQPMSDRGNFGARGRNACPGAEILGREPRLGSISQTAGRNACPGAEILGLTRSVD